MAQGNDIKSFEEMFRRFHPPLVKYASTILYAREEAVEAVQDVFVNVWNKRDQLEFGAELKAYLYRAVRNHCLNRIRKQQLDTVSLDEQLINVSSVDDAGGGEKEKRLRMVFQEIDALPTNCREIFIMSRVEGLSHKEIAQILDISSKTVENQIGIALKKIRKGVFQNS